MAGFGIYQNLDVFKGNRIADHSVNGGDSVYYFFCTWEYWVFSAHKSFFHTSAGSVF
jgi:hypothetical protein